MTKDDDPAAVLRVVEGSEPIPRNVVLEWLRHPSLQIRAAAYVLTHDAWYRIDPEIPGDIQCDFMATYLLDCIVANGESRPERHAVHSAFEAATELSHCLKRWRPRGQAQAIANAASGLEKLFRAADQQIRNLIETAALEHILEDPGLRPAFAHWATDPELAEAHSHALMWGKAHELD